MEIDNFELLKNILDFSNSDDFYMVMALRRGKDHGDKENYSAREWVISRPERLDELKDEIITVCKRHGARAYLNPSPRSWRSTAFTMSHELLEKIREENYGHLHRLWVSAAAKSNGSKKIWVIDVDKDQLSSLPQIHDYLCGRMNLTTFDVPTKNGVHILTKPFDPREFLTFHAVELKKDSPTVLYIPEI